MCNPACLRFIHDTLKPAEITGQRILEVGSYNVNGSARALVEMHRPAEYLGVDLTAGPGVDFVCDAETLTGKLPANSFDGLISTEMLEHCVNWRIVIHQMKAMLKPGGWLALTTRSNGFPYHEWPIDHWRFEVRDLSAIFADFKIEVLMPDPSEPGVFIKAYKPLDFHELDLTNYKVREIIKGQP